jgi:hypothetical protein
MDHDNEDQIPFTLEMSNMSNILTVWVKELHIDFPYPINNDSINRIVSPKMGR